MPHATNTWFTIPCDSHECHEYHRKTFFSGQMLFATSKNSTGWMLETAMLELKIVLFICCQPDTHEATPMPALYLEPSLAEL